MGMYTELYLSVALKKDVPKNVVEIIEHLFGERPTDPLDLPNHDFFKCSRWMMIGRCCSFYFTPMPTSRLYFDKGNTDQYYITTRSDLKNYDGEIGKFLDWVMPYIEAYEGNHLGHHRYEEDDQPTLIFYPKVA